MISVTDQQDIKREKILEAAHYRFLHYGYSKTTMNEIAGDLSMSKALLYYYFPDKSQLYIAVMRKVANEYIKILNDNSGSFNSIKEAFDFQINTNHDFIVTNYNFFDFFKLNDQNLPDAIWEIVDQVHASEVSLLVSAIEKETERGNIPKIENADQIIILLLDAMHGVKASSAPHKKQIFHNKEHLDEIRDKRLLLIDMFIKGLMFRCN